MQYQAPFGSVDPDAPYVDRNTPAVPVGSKIPAGFPNWVQNEIVDAIEKAGITPADELQLADAIKRLAGHGQCQLRYVSATQIKLNPLNGNRVMVAGEIVQLPAAGVTAANTGVTINGVGGSNLAASTVYLVALNASGGLDFWTLGTGHQVDTTSGNIGVEVITGNVGKTLVGMVRTNASSQFEVSPAYVGVISWFNRRSISLIGTTTPGSSTSSIGYVELTSASRVGFLTWADESVRMDVIGQGNNGTTAFSVSAGVGLDGVFVGIAGGSYTASGGQNSYTGATSGQAMAEGYHYVTPMGTVGAGGTGTFSVAALADIRG